MPEAQARRLSPGGVRAARHRTPVARATASGSRAPEHAIEVAPRYARLHGRENLDDERGDVVLAAALVGERDRRVGALLEIAVAAQLGDLLVVREVAVQAVAAQQEPVAGRDVDVGGVDLDVVLVADGARDDVLAGGLLGLLPSSSCRA